MVGLMKHRVFAFMLLAFVAMANGFTVAQAADQKRAVVELFTSQGCSSCPPADRILADYAKSKDVLALSWHVDYWNYLGWKDTFSKADFSDRQRRYAAAFKRRGVYTPQAVINGRDHVVGSRRSEIDGTISTMAKSGKALNVKINVVAGSDAVRIFTQSSDPVRMATLWLVYFDKEKTVKIKRGENRGETITYHNVVRDISTLGMAKNGKLDVTLLRDALKMKGYDSCALLLQASLKDGLPGPIIGATVIDDLRGG